MNPQQPEIKRNTETLTAVIIKSHKKKVTEFQAKTSDSLRLY